jgi:hypothetical protein
MTGRVFEARDAAAEAPGLFNHVVPAASVMQKAREIALEIARNASPMSLVLSRFLMQVWCVRVCVCLRLLCLTPPHPYASSSFPPPRPAPVPARAVRHLAGGSAPARIARRALDGLDRRQQGGRGLVSGEARAGLQGERGATPAPCVPYKYTHLQYGARVPHTGGARACVCACVGGSTRGSERCRCNTCLCTRALRMRALTTMPPPPLHRRAAACGVACCCA